MPLNSILKKRRKIVYVTSARLPTEKAHGLATVKMCEALAACGYEVDLVIPKLWRREVDIFQHYDLRDNFKIIKLPCIDLLPLRFLDRLMFILQSFSFSISLLVFVLFRYGKKKEDIIFFSHDYIPLYFMTFLSDKVFYDIHHFPGDNLMYRRLMKMSFSFAVQTKWKVGELGRRFGISRDSIVYWPNGTDVYKFDIALSRDEARKALGLVVLNKMVVYTGALFDWKGVDSLIISVSNLYQETRIYIVGGTPEAIVNCRKNIPEANDERVSFIPFEPHERIPLWLKAADVLVLPNTGKQKVSLYYTSPMKLFEYMAAGRPIVSSATPSIMEILNENNAVLVEPDNPLALAKGINRVLGDPLLAEHIASNALKESKKYTWRERAEKVSGLIEKNA